MNKINLDKVEFRNFLSFGNTWQTFHFKKGLNLIQGFDTNTGKSNGSGKSSLVELLPFALYGQTIKGIKKDEIPNWVNKSKCQVKLYFSIGDNKYCFHRGIKPNKFVVYKNNETIPQLSNVRDFQIKINEEILGMDFKTFSNLIYFSPNTTVSILNAKKDQKRKFLESLFDLKEYSEMLRLCNPKLTAQKTKVSLCENNIEHIKANIEITENDIRNSSIPDMKPLKRQVSFLKLRLDALRDETDLYDEYKYKQVTTRLDDLKKDEIDFNAKKRELLILIQTDKKILESVDVEVLEQKHTDINNKIQKYLLEIYLIINRDEFIINEEQLIKVIDRLSDEINDITQKVDKFSSLADRLMYDLKSKQDQINDIDMKETLDGVDMCPLCKQDIDHNRIKSYYIDERDRINTEHQSVKGNIDKIELKIKNWNTEISEITKKKGLLDDQYQELLGLMEKRAKIEDKVTNLNEIKDSLDDIGVVRDKYNVLTGSVLMYQNQLTAVVHKLDMTQMDISIATDTFNEYEKEKIKHDKIDTDITDTKRDLNELNTRINELDKIKENELKRVQEKQQSITDLTKEIGINESNIRKYNTLIDYLEYIKISLKDENIKQYAISSLLPFLNKRTNYYLSESGFPYIVSIDGWLEVDIKGFGVSNASYTALSGGERKSIDIALQFACNDIASIQASTIIDVGIYDEMLDTSLDEQSLIPLVELIRVKQQDNDLSVYIITHKSEIKELDFDNFINIEKNNGFSTIRI